MASTFNGINPGIDSDIVVVTIVAGRMTVTVTSDLDPAYDDDLQRLATMDYSGVGGNPITQYHDGLRSIHLEGFSNKVGYDFNFQGNGAIGTGYSLTRRTGTSPPIWRKYAMR